MRDITMAVFEVLSKEIRKNATQIKSTRDTYKPAVQPSRKTMNHDESTVLTGGAIVAIVDGNQQGNMLAYQTSEANGDSFTHSVVLTAGTYLFSVLGKTNSDHGIIDWSLDEYVLVLGQDWWSAGPVYNVVKTINIVLPVNRNYVLKGILNGKEPASNGYKMALTKFYFKQVTD